MSHACNHDMVQFFQELPKCEHHLHLEGTLSPTLLFKLINKHQVSLPSDFPKSPEALKERYNQFANLDDFLHFYYIGMNVLIDEEDFYELAKEYFVKCHEDGVSHLEAFFDPQGHLSRGIKFETFLNGFIKAANEAEKKFGVTSKLIMCLLRHLPVPDCLDTLSIAEQFFKDGKIHGLGLDSSEKPFPPELFTECYSKIKTSYPQIGLTAHAGEEGGPEYVENSLNLLNVTRIDHGINSFKDEKLMEKLATKQTMLTICPISNLKLQVVKSLDELPLNTFLEKNVPFSINSDDPAYFNGYVLDNYVAVQKSFGFDLKTWIKIVKNGINGSWISAERKKSLCGKADEVYEKFKYLEN